MVRHAGVLRQAGGHSLHRGGPGVARMTKWAPMAATTAEAAISPGTARAHRRRVAVNDVRAVTTIAKPATASAGRDADRGRSGPLDKQRSSSVDQSPQRRDRRSGRGRATDEQPTALVRCRQRSDDGVAEEHGERDHDWEDVARLLADGCRVERERGERPHGEPNGTRVERSLTPRVRQLRDPERHEERPRQETANDDGNVVPRRPRHVVPSLGEAVEVLREKETLEVGHTMLDRHGDVPRRGDENEDRAGQCDVNRARRHRAPESRIRGP